MKCMNCGAEVPDDLLRCPNCGQEIQIVPDYNPLDDVLAAQVKGAMNETLSDEESYEQSRRSSRRKKKNTSTRNTYHTGNDSMLYDEGRTRRQAERKRQMQKKRKQKRIILSICVLAAILVLGIIGYTFSYSGQVKKGEKYLAREEFELAEKYFQKAVHKHKERVEAYNGLSDMYLEQNDFDKAEAVYLDAISTQKDNVNLYRALIDFYINTDQEHLVAVLLDKCNNENVHKQLEPFYSAAPKFDLDPDKIYDNIQVLKLTTTAEAIYYTTDGTEPTVKSEKYHSPIKLEEGVTEVQAISVNKKGIPSLVVSKTYTIKFPVADAPSVTPSTGQYDSYQMITIDVPEGYKAYYTLDGSEPKPGSGAILYKEPISMPGGNTVFNAALVDSKGRISEVTMRNYELIISE